MFNEFHVKTRGFESWPLDAIVNRMESSTNNLPTTVPIDNFGLGRKMREFKAKVVLCLSITQIVIGCLCIVLMSLAMGLDEYCFVKVCKFGYGIQAGLMFCVSGTVGCCSSKLKINKCLIIVTMVMNITSAVFTAVPIIFGLTETVEVFTKKTTSTVFVPPIVILSAIETIIAIVTSAFCCKFVCDCCNDEFEVPTIYETKAVPLDKGDPSDVIIAKSCLVKENE